MREPNMAAPPLCHTHRCGFLLTGKMADEDPGKGLKGVKKKKNQWETGWLDGEDTAGWRLVWGWGGGHACLWGCGGEKKKDEFKVCFHPVIL